MKPHSLSCIRSATPRFIACALLIVGLGSTAALAQPRLARPVSVPDPSAQPQPRLTGNGGSDSPRYSQDGRFIVFSSTASDLTTNDVNGIRRDVFVREVAGGRTTLVSVNPAGVSGNGDSYAADITADGRFVAFVSRASDLVPGDTNRVADVFVRDMVEGRTVIASIATDGTMADGENHAPRIVADGRVVVFGSRATNLDPTGPDDQGRLDVYLRHLGSGVTTLVSAEARQGPSHDVDDYDASADGRWVAFRTLSTNVVEQGPTGTASGAYVRDMQSGTTTRLELNLIGSSGRSTVEARSLAFAPGRSRLAVGTWLVGSISTSAMTNVVEVFDLGAEGVRFVGGGIGTHGLLIDEPTVLSFDPTGEVLAFAQPSLSGQPASLRLWRESTGAVTVTNRLTGLPVRAREVAVAPGGTRVAFTSPATNLVEAGTPANTFQLYLIDPATGDVGLVTTNASGLPIGGVEYGQPSFNAAGRLVFQCASDALVPGDRNTAFDVFEWEPASRSVVIASSAVGRTSEVAYGRSTLIRQGVSADGRRVLFASTADDLVAGDAKGQPDLFVRDLVLGRTELVTVPGEPGGPSRPGFSEAALSANGRFVAFTAELLVTREDGTTVWTPQVFVRDLAARTTRAVALTPDGKPATMQTLSHLRISADGRYVAFFNNARDLVEGAGLLGQVVVRDLVEGRNGLVQTGASRRIEVTLAGIGGRTLYFRETTLAPPLTLFDPVSGVREEFAVPAGSSGTLSHDGRRVVIFEPGTDPGAETDPVPLPARVRWRDDGQAVFQELALAGDVPWTSHVAAISRNGRWVALHGRTASPVGSTWVVDLEGRTVARAEVAPDGSLSGLPVSRWPSFSADGRFLAFQSPASDLVAADPDAAADVFVRDLIEQRTTRVARVRDGLFPTDPAGPAVFSADGKRLVFSSQADGFLEWDDNQAGDVFVLDWEGSPPQDSDGDGLDDTWELTWFGNLARTGGEDFDGDGMLDREEFEAGTCPLDDRSRFVLEASVIGQGERSLDLRWQAAAGRRYQVQASDTATGGEWSGLGEEIVGTGQPAEVRLALPTTGARYFRIRSVGVAP